mmetsp:Transcript_39824/g.116221  ORF Transcript_39824/g.116221 Transcript_39824/m.116221 type:complete len:257 (+) Transcript_39824:125-895(+)
MGPRKTADSPDASQPVAGMCSANASATFAQPTTGAWHQPIITRSITTMLWTTFHTRKPACCVAPMRQPHAETRVIAVRDRVMLLRDHGRCATRGRPHLASSRGEARGVGLAGEREWRGAVDLMSTARRARPGDLLPERGVLSPPRPSAACGSAVAPGDAPLDSLAPPSLARGGHKGSGALAAASLSPPSPPHALPSGSLSASADDVLARSKCAGTRKPLVDLPVRPGAMIRCVAKPPGPCIERRLPSPGRWPWPLT